MIKQRVLAAAVVSVLSAGLIGSGMIPALAADKAPSGTPATEQAPDKAAEADFVKVSDDALMTMRNLHSARLAIFNGLPDQARTYVDASALRAEKAVKDAEQFALDTKQPKQDDLYVPFDASLTLMDTFKPTPENTKHIAEANEHLHKGERKEAMEVLQLGEIDVAVTAGLIPVKYAKAHIDDAAKLIADHKYYEANLALKAVEDAAVIETFAMSELPKHKGKG